MQIPKITAYMQQSHFNKEHVEWRCKPTIFSKPLKLSANMDLQIGKTNFRFVQSNVDNWKIKTSLK